MAVHDANLLCVVHLMEVLDCMLQVHGMLHLCMAVRVVGYGFAQHGDGRARDMQYALGTAHA